MPRQTMLCGHIKAAAIVNHIDHDTGGIPAYIKACEEIVADNYRGFEFRKLNVSVGCRQACPSIPRSRRSWPQSHKRRGTLCRSPNYAPTSLRSFLRNPRRSRAQKTARFPRRQETFRFAFIGRKAKPPAALSTFMAAVSSWVD